MPNIIIIRTKFLAQHLFADLKKSSFPFLSALLVTLIEEEKR
jgi:hypothetical protein